MTTPLVLPKQRSHQKDASSPLSPRSSGFKSFLLRLFSPTSSTPPKPVSRPRSNSASSISRSSPKNYVYFPSKSSHNTPLTSPIEPQSPKNRIRKAKSTFALFHSITMTSSSKPSLVGSSVRNFTDVPKSSAAVTADETPTNHIPTISKHNELNDPSIDDLLQGGALLNNDDDEYTELLFDKNGKLKELNPEQERLEPTLSSRLETGVVSSLDPKSGSKKEEQEEAKEEVLKDRVIVEEDEEEESSSKAEKKVVEPESKIEEEKTVSEKKEQASTETKSTVSGEDNDDTVIPSLEEMINGALTDLDSKKIYGYKALNEEEKKKDTDVSPLSVVNSHVSEKTETSPKAKSVLTQVASYSSTQANDHKDEPHPPEYILERDSELVAPAAAREGSQLTMTNSYRSIPHNRDNIGTTASSINILPSRPNLAGGDSYQNTVSETSSTTEDSYLKTLSKTLSYQSNKSSKSLDIKEDDEQDALESEGVLLSDQYQQDPEMEETVDKVLEKVASMKVSPEEKEEDEEDDDLELDDELSKIIDEVNNEVEQSKLSENLPITPTKITETDKLSITPVKIADLKEDMKPTNDSLEPPKSPLEKMADKILEDSSVLKPIDLPNPIEKSLKEESEKIDGEPEIVSREISEDFEEKVSEKEKVSKFEGEVPEAKEEGLEAKKEVKAEVKEEKVQEDVEKPLQFSKSTKKDDIDSLLEGKELNLDEIAELEKMLNSDILTTTAKSLKTTPSYRSTKPASVIDKTPSVTLLPKPESQKDANDFEDEIQQQIINDLKNEPVYIYTSLASGGFHMIPRTNRLATILTANKVPFTFRDLGTDEEARKVWKRYSNGRGLPGVVRGKDDIIGDYLEMDEFAEYYEVRKRIYEMY